MIQKKVQRLKKSNKKARRKFRPSVFIVTYCLPKENTKSKKKDNKIEYLVLKRNLHWKGWEIPKGGISIKDLGSKKKAVRRELKEETNLNPIRGTIKNHKIKGSFLYSKTLKDRSSVGMKYTVFSAEVPNKKVRLDKNKDKEHTDYKWLSYNEAEKKLTYKNQKQALREVHNCLKQKLKN